MQDIQNQYVCFVALWCIIINTYIVFSSSNVKALEQREKKGMEKIIYFITTALVLSDMDTYMLAGMDAKWVYWNLEIVTYSMYLLKYLYLTVFTLFIMKESSRFVKVKKILLAVSILCGIIGMICISLPDIRKEFYYFSSDNYFYYSRLYNIIRVTLVIDILVLLTAMLLEKKQYSRKTFNIYGICFPSDSYCFTGLFYGYLVSTEYSDFLFVHDYFYRSYDTGFRSVDGYKKRIIAF